LSKETYIAETIPEHFLDRDSSFSNPQQSRIRFQFTFAAGFIFIKALQLRNWKISVKALTK